MTKRKNKSISILFIGNSFSYYHALPKLIADIAQASGFGNLTVDGAFRGGATLQALWHDGKALKKLRSRDWSYVILQERGRLGGIIKHGVVHVGKPRVFFVYATKFHREIERIGATTILYCPPSFLGTNSPHDAKKLNAAYATLARKLNVEIISPRTAFALASKKRPHLNLYERDGQHPNPLGMYLIACLFYKKLFHKRISRPLLRSYSSRSAKIPKNPKLVKLSKADAQFFLSIANRTK